MHYACLARCIMSAELGLAWSPAPLGPITHRLASPISPSRPCPGCVFLWEMSISFWAPPEQDGTFQILQKHIAEETMQVNGRKHLPPNQNHIVFEFALIFIMSRFAPMLAQDVFIQTQHAQSMGSSI